MFFSGPARAPSYHPAYRVAVTGALDHEAAERLLGTSLTCKGIHLPKDPSPKTLSGQAAQFWHAAFDNANGYYDDRKIAEKTAWKALRCFFRKTWRGYQVAPALPLPGRGPTSFIGNPGELTQLGTCLEYTFIDGNANLEIRRFPRNDPPFLYWSTRLRTCFVFPGSEPGPCQAPDLSSQSAVDFQRWAQREAECLRDVDVPEVNLQMQGAFDTVVYGSDKWHDPHPDDKMVGSQEYIHQVGDGVGLWRGPGKVPAALAFTGGCLDMEERGLIH